MAQQDTGLGWSAESAYLVNLPGVISSFSGYVDETHFPGQPVPYFNGVPSNADCRNYGMMIGTYKYNANYQLYIVSLVENTFVFRESSSSDYVYAACPVTMDYYGKAVYYCGYNPNDGSYMAMAPYKFSDFGRHTLSAQVVAGRYENLNPNNTILPIMSSSDAATYITNAAVSENVYKLNQGYAVGCVATWYSPEGTELTGTILISSNADYATLSLNGTDPATQGRATVLYDGMSFIMSYLTGIAGGISAGVPVIDLKQFGASTPEKVFRIIADDSIANIVVISAPDPYEEQTDPSEEEGGDGEELEDDKAGIEAGSDFPSAINTGFCRIFSPSESDLRSLSNYLWSNSYDLTQVKKLFSNPMDSILGLSAVPIRLLGSSVSFSLGGVPITGMTLPLVQQQRYTYHMGAITIKERWGSYLDYDPYTKFSIFLPFIGMRELSADDIMGKTVGLVYDIDILTGMCVARLQAGSNCLYEWGGNCAIQLPVNSRNWDSVFSTAVSAVGGVLSAVTGGSAPLVAGSVASAALQTVSMKPRIDKSSTIGGAAGWLGQMTPYIIRTTPEAFIPTDQNKFIGYPAYINIDLASVVGYNEVESIHLENVTATGAELEEIESILKGGVIF